MKLWVAQIILGALFGFGAAMGVVTFCVLTDNYLKIMKYLRSRALRFDRWKSKTL